MINLLFILTSFLPYFSLISLVVLMKVILTESWREAFLYGLVLWGMFFLVLTEVLSFFHLLDYFPILLSWGVCFLLVVIALILKRNVLRKAFSFVWQRDSDPLTKIICLIFLIIFILTAVSSFICPPNTWDSLTYHIARVAHWVQNRTVDFYPTHILRQVVSPMWLEYAALHFQILSRGDYFANSIQWISMVGSVVGASLIAQYLGVSFLGQVVTAVMAATIPMGIIQASSMQADYATTLWLVCAMGILLNAELSWKKVILFSLSIGLAFLTKGTGIVFGMPLIIGFLIKTRFHAGKFLVFWIIIFLMMGSYLIRNYQSSPRSVFLALDVENVGIKFRDISWSTIVANSVRNTGMQLATGSNKINHTIETGLYQLTASLGADINDPKATFGNHVFHISKPSRDENYAQSGAHFIIYILCFIIAFSIRPQNNLREYGLYLLGMFLGLVLFVRWQPWSARFHLPLFVMGAPIVGYVCDRLKIRFISIVIIFLFFGMAVPYLITASPRHLLGKKSIFKKDRISDLFVMDKDKWLMYSSAISYVRSSGCKQIGLIIGGDSWDYPFYRMLNPYQDKSIRIEHVMVDNFTNAYVYPLGDFAPCAIMALTDQNTLKFKGRILRPSYESGGIKVFNSVQ